MEGVFRTHAAGLDTASLSPAPGRLLALDGKVLRGSFDNFHDSKAKQILSAFAVETSVVLAHIEIDEKSNEIPAAQKLLEELDVAGRLLTLDALHRQKKPSRPPPRQTPT